MTIENNQAPVNQSRWQSPYLWTALFAVLGFILGNWGLYDVIGINEVGLTRLFDLVLTFLIALGVINSPTTKNRW